MTCIHIVNSFGHGGNHCFISKLNSSTFSTSSYVLVILPLFERRGFFTL